MNLRQLSYFLQIAELQSFTRAANVLHVAQPSLSRQIQMLEQELGVLLFVRSDKGVKLTEAGLALQERAGAVLQQVRQIRDEIGLQSREPKGELRVGLPFSLFDLVTVPLLCQYHARYPEVKIHVSEGVSAVMHELVLTGRLDTAVVSDAEPLGLLRSELLLREQLYLVGPPAAQLSAEREVAVEELADRPLILTSRPNALRLIVESALADHGQRLTPVLEADSSRLLSGLVAHGQGFTVLPFSAIAEPLGEGRLTVAPVKGLTVTWTLVTSRERNLSLAARKLRELIFEIARKHIVTGRWRGVVALD